MSATVADILRGAGFVPVVPELSRTCWDKESKAASLVPVVPAVPVKKYKGAIETPKTVQPERVRSRLVRLANAKGRDPALVDRIAVADLQDYADMDDAKLSALLSMLSDDADREAGRVPTGDTAVILCRSCGPVWVNRAIAAVLPVVGGWPRALGCPWCFIRAAGGYIPRPCVAAAACTHWIPDAVNPSGGRGRCRCGPWWPAELHGCKDFQPTEPKP